MVDYDRIVKSFIETHLVENQFSSATFVATGFRWAGVALTFDKFMDIEILDKDPDFIHGPFKHCEPIFEEVEINTDVIVSFHAELLYPLTRLYKGNHIMVVREQELNHKICTNDSILVHENDLLEKFTIGPKDGPAVYNIYYGEIKDVKPVHIPVYTSLQDRTG